MEVIWGCRPIPRLAFRPICPGAATGICISALKSMRGSGHRPPGCALLVASCDAYSDLWMPFFALLRRHWPNCPFPIYLGSGNLECRQPQVTTLFSDGGRDWSLCMRDYLGQLEFPHVLMMLDDFFLRKIVPTERVIECLEFAQRSKATQVRLVARPGPTDRLPGERLVGECAPALPYRLSTQAAIWDRQRLMDLLCPEESIWEFEHNGNRRAEATSHGFYAVWKPVLPYEGILTHHVVEKGKWLAYEKWNFGRQRIGCDFTRRNTLPLGQTLLLLAAALGDRLLIRLPWRARTRCKLGLKRITRPLFRKRADRMSGRHLFMSRK